MKWILNIIKNLETATEACTLLEQNAPIKGLCVATSYTKEKAADNGGEAGFGEIC